MLTMRVVNAHEGDCFLLLYGTETNRHALLCDGGPAQTFDPHLRATLASLGIPTLDAVILSHVDNDHVIGLLELFAEIRDRPAGAAPLVTIRDLWINAFDKTIDDGGHLETRLAAVVQSMQAQNQAMAVATAALTGVREGHTLNLLAAQIDVPVNAIRGGSTFIADGTPPVALNGLHVRVVGPSTANLDALADAWATWLDTQEARVGRGDLRLASMSDKSVPNLSSIQLLVEAHGKRLLLTGDGRGDHLLDALGEVGLLAEDDTIHVDVLKVPHHGSDRNVTRRFFEQVRATTYVISADGKNGNPDLPTLQWIVASRPENDPPITLVLTNRTKSVQQLVKALPPDENGYALRIREDDEDFIDVQIA